jgi:anti-sigma B factor antagonist
MIGSIASGRAGCWALGARGRRDGWRVAMPPSESRLRVARQGEVTQVEFVDRNILDEANIQAIGEEISRLIDEKPMPKMLISFSNVDHLSSAALGALITIDRKVKEKKGALKLANIDPHIYEVFAITRLNRLFDIHESTESALKDF